MNELAKIMGEIHEAEALALVCIEQRSLAQASVYLGQALQKLTALKGGVDAVLNPYTPTPANEMVAVSVSFPR